MLKKKKPVIFLAVFLLVMAGVLAIVISSGYFLLPKKDISNAPVDTSQPLDVQLDIACELFSEDKAKTLLGESAVKSNQADEQSQSFSDDIAASQCVYLDQEYQETTPPEMQKQASLKVRKPRNEAGRQANEAVFIKGSLPTGSEEVAGYGEMAFWNDEFGQLNILRDGEWYILEYGSMLPESRNLGDSVKFADILEL